MNIDSILTEWQFRLPAGYPKTKQDYDVLAEILVEKGIDLDAADRLAQQARDIKSAEQQSDGKFSELNLPVQLLSQVLQIYSELSPQEKAEFDKNYRQHSIDSFLAGGYKPFVKFYNILDSTKAGGSIGRGEIEILLAVADSKSGGTAQHDIVMQNGEWEVKEVGKATSGTKAKTFRPAAAGMTQQGDLLSKIQDFFNDVVVPYSKMPDPFETLKHVVDQDSWPQLSRFIEILDKVFVPLIPNVQVGREISYNSGWQAMYVAFKHMNDIFWRTELDADIQDTRLSIKTQDKQSSYWITDNDYDKIERGAGNADAVNIHIGEPVADENTNAIIWFSRIKRSTFIATPDAMILEFNQIKNKFFDEILGLIIYDIHNQAVPQKTLPTDWSIIGVSQGMWVFGLTSTFDNKYTFIHLQS